MPYIMLSIGMHEYNLLFDLLRGAFDEVKIEHEGKEDVAVMFKKKFTYGDYYVLHSILLALVERD